MASKTKKPAAKKSAKKSALSGSKAGDVAEVVRRLVCGDIRTEEDRADALALLGEKTAEPEPEGE